MNNATTKTTKPTKKELISLFYNQKRDYGAGYSFACNWIMHQCGGGADLLQGLFQAWKCALEVQVINSVNGSGLLIDGWSFTWAQLRSFDCEAKLAAAIMLKEAESDAMERESYGQLS